jgi:hypothetical protein
MSPRTIRDLDEVFVQFHEQPDPVPASLRPERRVPLLLLLVARSHGAGVDWKTLQLLNWTVQSAQRMELLVALQQRDDIPDRPVVRFEPALDRALDLALGLKLLEQKTSRSFRLTESGKEVVREIEKSEAFELERQLLDQLKRKVTQAEVDRVLEWRER